MCSRSRSLRTAQHGNCHSRGFVGWVRDGEAMTYKGTDEQRTLSSKRDNSKRSGGVTPEHSHSWTKRLDRWRPLIAPRGSSSVFQWLCTSKLRWLPGTCVCGCSLYLALAGRAAGAGRKSPASRPHVSQGPGSPAGLRKPRQKECQCCYGFLFC